MPETKLVSYYRVSTDKQGQSGLGLDAQQTVVGRYAETYQGKVIASFTEIETGKRADRPELARALGHAKRAGAVLVIAKLDRLARNTRFLLTLIESGADVAFCDLPHVPPGAIGKFLLTQMAAVAELEAGLISERTKAALAAYKTSKRISKRIRELYPQGVPDEIVEATAGKLGSQLPQCRKLGPEDGVRGGRTSGAKSVEMAKADYGDLLPSIRKLRGCGMSYREIATRLNLDGHTTRQGKNWNSSQVWRVLTKYANR